jgi:ATP-dependent DNA helicase PIF1
VEFAELLESVGNGSLQEVIIPPASLAISLDDLVMQVMGPDLSRAESAAMVLTLTLDDAEAVNNYCLSTMPGLCREVYAADTYVDCRQPDQYPPEVVSGIRIPGVPPQCLNLKVGARYMIVKNMMKNVFNGVRCVLVAMAGSKSVFVRLISGPGAGQTILLPAIVFNISPEQSGLPFSIRRRQLPMIPAFAVTVHKAQGQTLSKVGLYITTPMFTHGQLYTALSRTRGWSNIRVYNSQPNCNLIQNCICAHVLR